MLLPYAKHSAMVGLYLAWSVIVSVSACLYMCSASVDLVWAHVLLLCSTPHGTIIMHVAQIVWLTRRRYPSFGHPKVCPHLARAQVSIDRSINCPFCMQGPIMQRYPVHNLSVGKLRMMGCILSPCQ